MPILKICFSQIIYALMLLSSVASAESVSLGELILYSNVGQPFHAEIRLKNLQQGVGKSLQVKFPQREIFESAGLKKTLLIENLGLSLQAQDQGHVVRIVSSEPVHEKSISFLIDVTWNSGGDRKEYTVLLGSALNQNGLSQKAPAHFSPTKSYSIIEAAESMGENHSIEKVWISANDTLYNVAERVRPSEHISVNQMMMALLRRNPDKFIHQNINLVKANHYLDIPDIKQIESMRADIADQKVIQHYKAWKNGDQRLLAIADDDENEVDVLASIEELIDPDIINQPETTQHSHEKLVSFRDAFSDKSASESSNASVLSLRPVTSSDHSKKIMPIDDESIIVVRMSEQSDRISELTTRLQETRAELQQSQELQMSLDAQVQQMQSQLTILKDYISFAGYSDHESVLVNSADAETKQPELKASAKPPKSIMTGFQQYLFIIIVVLLLLILVQQFILLRKR